MRILDYLGGLWNKQTVGKGQKQTDLIASSVMLKRTWATHPSRGITPAMLTTIMDHAERGYLLLQHELFIDMEERDPHLHAEMSKRKRTVLGLPRQVIAPPQATSQEIDIAAKVNEIINNTNGIDTLILDLLDAIGHGFSCSEITWEFDRGVWQPAKFEHRPPYWFQLDIETRTKIRLRNMSVDGEELWPFGWIVHKHAAKSGEISRSGLFRTLAWPWLMKQYSLRDLAEYLEIYGLPVKIGKYPRNAPEDDKDNLYTALQQLGRNAAGIMPDDMNIEFLKESLGSADPYMKMIDYCDSTMSTAILGQVLSTRAVSTGLGSGVATLQGNVRQDILEADAAQLSVTLTEQLVYPLLVLNGWDTGRPFTYDFETSSPENLELFAQTIQRLVAAGVPVPLDWIRKKTGIPAPAGDEGVIGGPQSISAPVTQPGASAALSISKPHMVTPSTYVDTQVQRLEKDMSPILNAILKHVHTKLKDANSLEDFRDSLVKWFPEAETLDLADVLSHAFMAAELAGRYDAAVGK